MRDAGDVAREFEVRRRSLFGLAYRMLGSAQEAEDVVQDAFLRWNGADHAAIAAPSAWLAKVVTNLCVNRLTSARARREAYAGPWLPEPVLTSGDDVLGPVETVEQRESVSLALLVALERLAPAERAVLVLREAFGYSHREIADVLGVSEAGSRQLHRRARRRIGEPRPRFEPDRKRWRELVERFLDAARRGDLGGLERLLADDVTAWTDGGGRVTAARRPVAGRERVARYFARISARADDAEIAVREINGAPAVLARHDGQVIGVLAVEVAVEVAGSRIAALHLIANPDKLRFIAGQLSRSGTPSGS